jgi:hypothetical protein
MKLLMLIVDDTKKEELEVLLGQSEGVLGFTELPNAVGSGRTGPRFGSRAFPRTSAVIFTVVTEEARDRLAEEIRAYCRDCGEHLKMVSWSVEEVL